MHADSFSFLVLRLLHRLFSFFLERVFCPSLLVAAEGLLHFGRSLDQDLLLADHDHNGAGQAAADVCMQRWEQAGRAGVRLLPERPGADFNDIVLEKRLERT